jgi:hypothetical protein
MIFNFGHKIRRVARRQRQCGKLSNTDYQRIVTASRDPKTVLVWKTAIEKEVAGAPWTQDNEDNIFSRIWDWFIENWGAILKILPSPRDKIEEDELEDSKPEEMTDSRDEKLDSDWRLGRLSGQGR